MKSFWWAIVGIVVVLLVIEWSPKWGGIVLIIVVFGMLLTFSKRGGLGSTGASSGSF